VLDACVTGWRYYLFLTRLQFYPLTFLLDAAYLIIATPVSWPASHSVTALSIKSLARASLTFAMRQGFNMRGGDLIYSVDVYIRKVGTVMEHVFNQV
jgi:hypothetical protein